MKLAVLRVRFDRALSLPVRGAWIEIVYMPDANLNYSSLPVRGAWIEIELAVLTDDEKKSLPVRGAWIEIFNNQ